MRVLLIAPADRDDVGEAWVAHQWASLLSARHDVTLLTYRKRGRPRAADQLPQTRVVEWTEPPLLGRFERGNSLLKPGWVPFHHRARRWIRTALARGEHFDVAHQPVPVAVRYPTPLAGLGIPYIVGPVGGSLDTPAAFAGGDTAPWYTRLRALDGWRLRHDPLLRRSFSDASCVVGIASYVRDVLRDVPLHRFETMSETGIAQLPPAVDRRGRAGPVRLLFVGRVIRTKGVRDAIHALALLAARPVLLDVVGDGFDRAACERLAVDLGVTDRVVFHGARPRAEVEDFYARADVFLFPSFREPGGNAVFEAMAAGLPLVVANRGGPASAVDDSCAIRIDPTTPEQFAAELAAAVDGLVTDPQRRLALGEAARLRAAAVALWPAKIEAMERLYHDVLR